jgi:CysZ protein
MKESHKNNGILYIHKGFTVLRTHKELWKYCLIPAVLTFLLLIPMVYYVPSFFSWLTNILQPDILSSQALLDYFNGDANVLVRWLAIIFGGLLLLLYTFFVWVIIFAAILMLMILLFISILKVIAAPFNDILSGKIEALHGNVTLKPVTTWDSIRVAAISELQRFSIFLAIALPLYFFAFFLPGIGHAIVAVILVLYSCFWYTYDAMSYSMDRYGWSISKRVRFLLKHWASSLSFGGGIYVVALIPIVNLFILPLFVSGGTLLFIDKANLEAGAVENLATINATDM